MQGHPQLVFATFVHVIFQHSLVIREVLVTHDTISFEFASFAVYSFLKPQLKGRILQPGIDETFALFLFFFWFIWIRSSCFLSFSLFRVLLFSFS